MPCSLVAQYQLRGSITNKTEGIAISSATVTLLESLSSTISDAKGEFSFNDLSKGVYTLEIQGEGYRLYRKQIQVNADQSLEIVLQTAAYEADEIQISATRASEKTATTYSEIDQEEISKRK